MHLSRKIILVFVIVSLSACAAKKATTLPHTAVINTPRSTPEQLTATLSITDPEQGLRSAVDAYKAGRWDTAFSISYQLAEQYPGTAWYKRSLFLAEQSLIQMDRASEADAAMLRVQAEYPELADYAVSMLADYHFAKARYTEAAALYQHIVDHHPESNLTVRSAYRQAVSLLQSYAYSAAAESFEKFLHDNPDSEFCPDAGIGLGKALTAEADLAGAVRAYQDVWIKYPGDRADHDVENALVELRGGSVEIPELTADELYERGINLFRTNQQAKAIETFANVLATDPNYPYKSDILFRTGISKFNLGRYPDATAILEKMVRDYPRDRRVPEALYWIGRSYGRLGDREKGIKAFQKILDSYYESEWADNALFLIGNMYREANDMKKATTFYEQLAADYPESKFADSAIWWKAWAYYTAGDYKRTERALQELITRYPRSFLVNQARYWQGRVAEKRGDASRAAVYYGKVVKTAPYTYYGYRASERLLNADLPILASAESADVDVNDDSEYPGAAPQDQQDMAGPPVWTEEALKTLSTEPTFEKSMELMYLGMKKEAAAELWSLQDGLPRKRRMLLGLSKTFFELGDYHRSLVLVLRNYGRYLDGKAQETPQDFWLLAYPQGYWDSIVSYSRKYGQDPFFIAAIIRQESQFSSEALSPAGARGVMQIMPSTGEWVAQTIRLSDFDRTKLFDSDTAINLGTWYIGYLMKRFKGDVIFATAAYNAGPDAVASWLSRNGHDVERDEFVESIPFPETRWYVKKVLRNYEEYKRIYDKTSLTTSLAPAGPEKDIGSMASGVEVTKP
jgi:soluble lytic murein transglycosylase